jgi:putative phosphoesterase
MLIGILSDSHDNLPALERAVRFFNEKKTQIVLHAGDFIAPFTIPRLKALDCDYKGVFGNNDGEKQGLERASQGRITEGPSRFDINGVKITLIHDLSHIKLEEEAAQLVVYGHTHQPQVLREKNRLLLNPGECGAWLYGKSTVAIADLSQLTAEIFEI